jgi:23S rRNA pseudouridine1911/1915/1917 synthase
LIKKTFQINDSSNTRLDIYLSNLLKNKSRNKIISYIKNSSIHVNGESKKPSYLLQNGDKIDISIETERSKSNGLTPENIDLNVLYEDENIIAIDKPSGIVMHPGVNNESGTLANGLLYHFKNLSNINGLDRQGIVHRLDANTSGIVLIAKTNESHKWLAEQFKNRTIKKVYYAITWGKWRFKSGKIEGNMIRKKSDPTCFYLTSTNEGKYSKSIFRVLRQYKNFACVKFEPYTGRTHQIRVHSSSFSNPIFGDNKYGGGIKKSNEYANEFRRISSIVISRFNRHALHAFSIEFELMNSNGKRLKLNSPIPDELIELEKRLSFNEN